MIKIQTLINKPVIPSQQIATQSCEQATLIALVKSGGYLGDSARSTLVKQHYAWIKSRCQRILNNEYDASDAAQETALRMFKALPSFEGRALLTTWLGRIVFNECMNVMRKNQKTVLTDHIEQLVELHQVQTQDYLPEEQDNFLGVHSVMRQLPDKSRDILSLRFLSEKTLEEISITLNIGLSATKMRLYRALQQFNDLYTLAENNERASFVNQ